MSLGVSSRESPAFRRGEDSSYSSSESLATAGQKREPGKGITPLTPTPILGETLSGTSRQTPFNGL